MNKLFHFTDEETKTPKRLYYLPKVSEIIQWQSQNQNLGPVPWEGACWQ